MQKEVERLHLERVAQASEITRKDAEIKALMAEAGTRSLSPPKLVERSLGCFVNSKKNSIVVTQWHRLDAHDRTFSPGQTDAHNMLTKSAQEMRERIERKLSTCALVTVQAKGRNTSTSTKPTPKN